MVMAKEHRHAASVCRRPHAGQECRTLSYGITDFTEVQDTVAQVLRLENRAFASYEGALEADEAFVEWFIARPGTEPSLCQAALDDETLASQVIVSEQYLQLGGETLRCAVIDSVATDPEHQRRGLARSLMERAHEAMVAAGHEAAVLYTNPEDHPYRFYRRLGYEQRARAALLLGPRPTGSGTAAEMVDAGQEASGLMRLINEYYADHEGFSPIGDDLWRWHKLQAPGGRLVVAEMSSGGPGATATFAEATVCIEGRTCDLCIAYDLAATAMNAEQFASLLSASPRETVGIVLDDAAPQRQWAESLGLRPRVAEVAMVLPLTDVARAALRRPGGPWYFMIESVIGV